MIKELLDEVASVQKEYGFYGEYVFQGKNGPLTVHIISSCLKNRCKELGLVTKGVHALRRTVNSIMRSNGLDERAAASMIGNTVNVNNMYYTFDVKDYDAKYAALEKANAQMSRV